MALEFTTVIGLEIHIQLNTKTKIFCNCSTDYIGATPNSTSARSAPDSRAPCRS